MGRAQDMLMGRGEGGGELKGHCFRLVYCDRGEFLNSYYQSRQVFPLPLRHQLWQRISYWSIFGLSTPPPLSIQHNHAAPS